MGFSLFYLSDIWPTFLWIYFQLTTVTAYMDLSLVYGSSAGQANPIRAGAGGRLLTILRKGQEWPPQDPNVTLTCESAKSPNEPCYLAGKYSE